MEGDKMSAGGGGLIQMILSRAIGRHLSSAPQPLPDPLTVIFTLYPDVVTEW